MMALSSGFSPIDVVLPAPAWADEEEVQQEDESNLTPYEKRQRELAKRRELLRQAREKALLKAQSAEEPSGTAEADGKVEAANAERRSAAEELKEELQQRASTYDQQAAKSPAPPPAPEPAPVEAPKLNLFTPPAPKPAPAPEAVAPPPPSPPAPTPAPAPAPFFSAPVKVEAPPPPPPAPKPAPAPTPKAEPAAAKKAEEQKPKKRRGPLPMFLAEVLVLGAMGGFVYGITTYPDQVGKARAQVGKALIDLSEKAEKAFTSGAK